MRKEYLNPETTVLASHLLTNLMGLSAPEEGISDGGEGDDNDDPNTKERQAGPDDWVNLW